MKVLVSLLALLSLATVIACFEAAISPGDQFLSILEEAEYPPKAPVGPALADLGLILAGTGVASNSTADLPLTLMMVESSRAARPYHAEKIFDDLGSIDPSLTPRSGGDGSDYRGQILLVDRPYLLGKIRISGELVVSLLVAEVVKRTARGEVVVGHLSIETERRDRLWDGTGVLSIEDGTIRGDYHVVLDMTPQGERSREVPSNDPEPPPDLFRIVAGSA